MHKLNSPVLISTVWPKYTKYIRYCSSHRRVLIFWKIINGYQRHLFLVYLTKQSVKAIANCKLSMLHMWDVTIGKSLGKVIPNMCCFRFDYFLHLKAKGNDFGLLSVHIEGWSLGFLGCGWSKIIGWVFILRISITFYECENEKSFVQLYAVCQTWRHLCWHFMT